MGNVVMDVCAKRLSHDCWGCPFKGKATRSKTCMEWIENNQEEAEKIATKFALNGWCQYDKNNPPYVGMIDKKHFQQICPRCDAVVTLSDREIYKDEYIGKWMWTCPNCHKEWKLMKSKKTSANLDASKGVTA